jgi:hypothetical protein
MFISFYASYFCEFRSSLRESALILFEVYAQSVVDRVACWTMHAPCGLVGEMVEESRGVVTFTYFGLHITYQFFDSVYE